MDGTYSKYTPVAAALGNKTDCKGQKQVPGITHHTKPLGQGSHFKTPATTAIPDRNAAVKVWRKTQHRTHIWS